MGFTYPISLDIKDKLCVIVGGGNVALRKANTLLAEGAIVKVISPLLCEKLAQLAQSNVLEWIDTAFSAEYLEGAFLVIAATDQREVNRQVADYCNEHHILVNVIDAPEESSFTVNAHFKRGDLLIAISTGGASPAISKKIKEQLQELFGEEYGIMLKIIADAREEAMVRINDTEKRREFLQYLAEMDLAEMLLNHTEDETRDKVKECLLSYLD